MSFELAVAAFQVRLVRRRSRAAGWTISQIAEHVGYHPATVSTRLRAGGPPAKRETSLDELLIDEQWRARIAGLLAENRGLQATSSAAANAGEPRPRRRWWRRRAARRLGDWRA